MTRLPLSDLKHYVLCQLAAGAERSKLISYMERQFSPSLTPQMRSDRCNMLFNQWTRPAPKSTRKALTSAANGRKGGRPRTTFTLKLSLSEAKYFAEACDFTASYMETADSVNIYAISSLKTLRKIILSRMPKQNTLAEKT